MNVPKVHVRIDRLILEGLPAGPGYVAEFIAEMQTELATGLGPVRAPYQPSSGQEPDHLSAGRTPTQQRSPAQSAADAVTAAISARLTP